MMSPFSKIKFAAGFFSLICSLLIYSCDQNNSALTADEIKKNEVEIIKMAKGAERDITAKGPKAWLSYFENNPDFFMASDGNLVFKDYPSAKTYITETLEYSLSAVKLKWGDIHVSSVSPEFATMASDFTEQLTNNDNKAVTVAGYFTCTVHKTKAGWKIRNAHWSIKKN